MLPTRVGQDGIPAISVPSYRPTLVSSLSSGQSISQLALSADPLLHFLLHLFNTHSCIHTILLVFFLLLLLSVTWCCPVFPPRSSVPSIVSVSILNISFLVFPSTYDSTTASPVTRPGGCSLLVRPWFPFPFVSLHSFAVICLLTSHAHVSISYPSLDHSLVSTPIAFLVRTSVLSFLICHCDQQ